MNSEREFWLSVWCDVNTTVSTLSLSERRHSACRGSLFLPRPKLALSRPPSSLSPSAARPARVPLARSRAPYSLQGGARRRSSSSMENTRSIARNYTHTPRVAPVWPAAASGETHAHARTLARTCVDARAPVRSPSRIFGPRKFPPPAYPPSFRPLGRPSGILPNMSSDDY